MAGWQRWAAGITFALCGLAAEAQAPQARVVQEMHNAPIGQIRVDASYSRLFTISLDKTVRIWRLSDLRPLRTVYLPAQPGPEGTPYALAVEPQGKRIYVAGVTGPAWGGAGRIVVIDAERGAVAGTLGRFDDDIVVSMDLAPGGDRLAVGLAHGGLRIVDVASGRTLHEDPAYNDREVTFVHYAVDGSLATTSSDGCVRLYAADMRLRLRSQYPPVPPERECSGSELGGIRFSPDGALLAFGLRYRAKDGRLQPEVVLMDPKALRIVRVVRADRDDQQSLCCIAWAPDGRALFVNGNVARDGPTPVYRLAMPPVGELVRWDAGEQQISNMLPLPDGGLVLATTAPSIARVDAAGRVASAVRHANVPFHVQRADRQAFRVSHDGSSVVLARGAGPPLRIDVMAQDQSRVVQVQRAQGARVHPVRRQGRVAVDTPLGHYAHRGGTIVNGAAVALLREEDVWSWAVHAQRPIAAIGTQWHIRLLDARGRPLPGWQEPPYLPAPAYHTVITGDGRRVVVALGDGTVRWYDIATAREVLGVFVHVSGEDWVAWRPEGHYVASPGGDHYLGWLINRAPDEAPDFFRAAQFERTLYKPDRIRAVFERRRAQPPEPPPRLAAPRVRIESIDDETREVRFSIDPAGASVTEVGVYVDSIPVLDLEARRALAATAPVIRTVRIPHGLAADALRVEAESATALGLDEAAPVRPMRRSAARGKLRVLAIGVRRFDHFMHCAGEPQCAVQPLPNAPNDARMLAEAFAAQRQKAFTAVEVWRVGHGIGPAPTKRAILEALGELGTAAPEDTTVVFLGSHGFTGGRQGTEYYFLPSDAGVDALRAVRQAAAAARSLLSGTELIDALRRLPGRRILIIDTCRAAAAQGSHNPYALARRSASAQIAMLSAARGDEQSYEHFDPKVMHGAFTHALLRSLEGAGDAGADGGVTLEQAFRFVTDEVKRNTARLDTRGKSQTPTLHATPALRESVLALRGP